MATSFCNSFYLLYTTRGGLHVHSSRTTQVIKSGLVVEGGCFLDCNEEAMAFAVLTLKGAVSLYRVKSEVSLIDGCTLEWQTTVLDLVRQRSLAGPVSVRHMRLLATQGVLVFMSDDSVFEYEPRARLWRQSSLSPQAADQILKA